jgi:hypothetical protein
LWAEGRGQAARRPAGAHRRVAREIDGIPRPVLPKVLGKAADKGSESFSHSRNSPFSSRAPAKAPFLLSASMAAVVEYYPLLEARNSSLWTGVFTPSDVEFHVVEVGTGEKIVYLPSEKRTMLLLEPTGLLALGTDEHKVSIWDVG